LINGKNVEKFIDDDIKEIHSIMSQTKINGVNIDVRLLNQALALKLEEALSELLCSNVLLHAKQLFFLQSGGFQQL
jgi:hypothetical protein